MSRPLPHLRLGGPWLTGLLVLALPGASSFGQAPPAEAPVSSLKDGGPSTSTGPVVERRAIALVVDTSASMAVNDPNAVLRDAVGQVIAGLGEEDVVGLLTFDSHARSVMPARRMGEPGAREALRAAVAGLAFKGRHTNIPDAIERSLYDLQRSESAGAPGLIVLVTDGLIDTGNPEGDASKAAWLRDDLLPACRAAGVRIFGVAFTEAADYELLRTMARKTGGSYYRALAPSDVPGIFTELEAALATPPPPEPPPPVRVRTDTPPLQPSPLPPESGLSGAAVGAIALATVALIVGAVALLRSRRRDDGDALPVSEAILQDLSDGSQMPLSKRITRIGRAPDNDLVIDSSTVSGRHALIEARGGVYHVADLRSTNGTYVNEKKIQGETVLRRGDILRFDRFKYAYDGVVQDIDQTLVAFDSDQTQVRISPWADPADEN